MLDRDTVQALYIRIARDSGFLLDWTTCAKLVANILGTIPLALWPHFPYLDDMRKLAEGNHPALRENGGNL